MLDLHLRFDLRYQSQAPRGSAKLFGIPPWRGLVERWVLLLSGLFAQTVLNYSVPSALFSELFAFLEARCQVHGRW